MLNYLLHVLQPVQRDRSLQAASSKIVGRVVDEGDRVLKPGLGIIWSLGLLSAIGLVCFFMGMTSWRGLGLQGNESLLSRLNRQADK